MEAFDALVTRSTVPPVKMAGPGPDEAQLRRILEAGAAAPDHGRLRPWRFHLVRGSARERLGELFARAAQAQLAQVSEAELEKQRTGPLRAPVVLVVTTRIARGNPKVPEVEQLASAAAAAQNMLLAAHALGFAGKWSTGRSAYDPMVRAAFGVAGEDQIVGFLYLGGHGAAHEQTVRPPVDEVVSEWCGEGA